jgi:hypothetical protein
MMAKDLVAVERRALTPAQFGGFADVSPELEWLANITIPKLALHTKMTVGEFWAGAQALLSVYLLAMWVLTQFGQPFE